MTPEQIELEARLADSILASFAPKIKPQSLHDALTVCRNASSLIASEQASLRVLLDTETNEIKRTYIKYQVDLVAMQLKRAAKIADARTAYFRSIVDWKAEKAKCEADILHWFKQWAWTLDPRKDSPLAIVPFVPFPFQEETILWLNDKVMVQRSDGVVEKSRDQGWTWISTGWSTYHWSFDSYFQALFGSKNEDAVDSIEEPDTILEKCRFQIRLLPIQMLPKGFDEKKHMGYMKLINPENKSVIAGEAPIPNFGRSGRYSVVFFDEHAAWPHSGRPQWTAASASSKSKISASTPQGTLTKQAELAKTVSIPKLTLKWDLHPWKDQRWYEGQTLSMDDQEIAQEIDIDYEASQPGPIYTKLWDKQYHVVTWKQFASVFGVDHKPHYWWARIYQDVGTSSDHPTATGWYTRPALRDSRVTLEVDGEVYFYDLKDTAILYRTMTIYGEEIGNIWDMMCNLMRPTKERDNLRSYRISHEAESERLTLTRKNKAQPAPIAWKPGTTRGISEFKSGLKLVDEDKPNPFKPWLMGRPTFIILVVNEQYDEPIDDFGMARFQEEIAAYHFPKQVIGEPVKAQKPYAFFNDHMDQSRIAAADGFCEPTPLLKHESVERALPPALHPNAIAQEEDPQRKAVKLIAQQIKRQEIERQMNKPKTRSAVGRRRFEVFGK